MSIKTTNEQEIQGNKKNGTASTSKDENKKDCSNSQILTVA